MVAITHESGEAFSRTVLNQVRAMPGVRAASGSLRRTLNVPDGFFGRGVRITAISLVGIEPRSAQTMRNYAVKEGRFLRPSDDLATVITTSLADGLGLKVGDRLPLLGMALGYLMGTAITTLMAPVLGQYLHLQSRAT